MINTTQFRTLIVRPVLEYLGLHSDAAENLVFGTAVHESRLIYLKQFPTGPALGVCQMETATHNDLWDNFLVYNKDLSRKVRSMAGQSFPPGLRVPADEMIGNMNYAVAMCRVHYLRVKDPIPDANNLLALAEYWKEHYNTFKGAGTAQQFIDHYRAAQ